MPFLFEHFDGVSLPVPWTALTNGSGTITVADSNVIGTTTAVAGSAAAMYKPFDRSRNQIVYHAWRCTATAPAARLWLLSRATPPIAEPRATITARQLFQTTNYVTSGKRYIRLQHRNAAGAALNWSSSTNVWSSSGTVLSMPQVTPFDDYVLTGMEWDAKRARARMFALHVASGTAFNLVSGPRLMALTEWVSFVDMQRGNDPTFWLLIGWPETDFSAAGSWFTEYVAESWGERIEAWANQKGKVSAKYNIKHHWGYDLGLGTWLPETRDNVAIGPTGTGYDGFQVQWGSVLLDDDRTYAMTYSAKPTSTGKISIALATAPTADGPWTKFAGNPIITQVTGSNRDQLTHSVLVKDYFEATEAKRYKMLCTGVRSSGTSRTVLYTAALRTGPWTYEGEIIPTDAVETSLSYRGAPLWYHGRWHLYYDASVAGVGVSRRASGKRLEVGGLEKDGVNAMFDGDSSAESNVTAVAGRVCTLVSTAGFARDQVVLYDNNTSADQYGLSRVRKVLSETQLELYHSMPGATATGQLRTANRGSEAVQRVLRLGSGFGWITTAFKVFTSNPALGAHHEMTALRRSATLPGTPTIDWIAAPLALLGGWNNAVSEENLRLLSKPYRPPPVLPRLRRDRNVLIRR